MTDEMIIAIVGIVVGFIGACVAIGLTWWWNKQNKLIQKKSFIAGQIELSELRTITKDGRNLTNKEEKWLTHYFGREFEDFKKKKKILRRIKNK